MFKNGLLFKVYSVFQNTESNSSYDYLVWKPIKQTSYKFVGEIELDTFGDAASMDSIGKMSDPLEVVMVVKCS